MLYRIEFESKSRVIRWGYMGVSHILDAAFREKLEVKSCRYEREYESKSLVRETVSAVVEVNQEEDFRLVLMARDADRSYSRGICRLVAMDGTDNFRLVGLHQKNLFT